MEASCIAMFHNPKKLGACVASSFTPHGEGVFQEAARGFLRPAGVPVIQLAWTDFRPKGTARGPEELAYQYDGAWAANPPALAAADTEVNEMNCVASAKVRWAV